jgi:hypothetical protein
MLELEADSQHAPEAGLLIAKIFRTACVRTRPNLRRPSSLVSLLGPRGTEKWPRRPFLCYSGYRSHPGPKKATLRGRSSTLRGLRGYRLARPRLKAERDLDSSAKWSTAALVLDRSAEGVGDHRFSSPLVAAS